MQQLQMTEQQQPATPRAFSRVQASVYLKEHWMVSCAASTLSKLASIGGGPRYAKAGKNVVYPVDELDAWARAKISPLVKSTAELKLREVA